MYRFFETLPGALTWLTLVAIVLCSWQFPVPTSIFIILFDIYWLLKTIYLSLHLRVTFNHMRANLKVNWLERVSINYQLSTLNSPAWSEIYHLIIFPMYKEPHAVVRESFESLTKVNYPKDKFLVVLAIEARAGEDAMDTAKKIEAEFGQAFGKFLVTVHPDNIKGELAGKGSNETWATKESQKEIIDPMGIPYENILVSVFDIDTQNYPHYFSRLTWNFLSEEDRLHAIYQPIPLFVNNVYQAPALARVVAFCTTFWQMMQQARPERLTSFSSQSIPFCALVDMGFWDTNVVSEDSHVFWQGYLRYNGNFRVVPMEYPVSMDAAVASTFWGTMQSLYKQHRRWAWGAENVPYMLQGFRHNKKIPRGRKWYWSFITIEGYHSWATNTLIIFALGWLPVLIGGGDFGHSLLSYNLPHITRLIIGLSTIGIAASAVLSILLLPKRTTPKKGLRYTGYFLEWVLVPVTLIIFGSFPAIEAQTRLLLGGKYRLGFWVTPKGRYQREAVSE
jgi:cellulose synthase/poly-beta-1,6-N-acetylglucosamine synthase-like glycosyltransferase